MTNSNKINFQQAAAEAFNFLAEKHNFTSSVDSDDEAVVFTNGMVSLRVFREPGSYMTYVEVCRKDTGEEYRLHEILCALAPDEVLSPQCSGADNTKIKRCLNQLGYLCDHYLQGIFTMDETAFDTVRKTATKMRRQYTLDAQYGAIKSRANLAWEHHDWDKARELYERAKASLSATEQRRLDFLNKRNSDG